MQSRNEKIRDVKNAVRCFSDKQKNQTQSWFLIPFLSFKLQDNVTYPKIMLAEKVLPSFMPTKSLQDNYGFL